MLNIYADVLFKGYQGDIVMPHASDCDQNHSIAVYREVLNQRGCLHLKIRWPRTMLMNKTPETPLENGVSRCEIVIRSRQRLKAAVFRIQ